MERRVNCRPAAMGLQTGVGSWLTGRGALGRERGCAGEGLDSLQERLGGDLLHPKEGQGPFRRGTGC